MTLIAVSQRMDFVPHHLETRDGLDHRWYSFLEQCRLTPLVIPNHPYLARRILEKIPIQGVLLTGGEDTSQRSDTESFLIRHAIERALPLFGVCHGMQMIQKYFSLNLIQITGHVSDQQTILVHNRLEEVNSYHNWGTTETVPELVVWAKAQDDVIKAIYHQTLPLIGIMWHPERYAVFKARDIDLVGNFFERGNLSNLQGAAL